MQRFERIYKDAKLPTRKTARSAGYDMYCYKDTEIPPAYSLKDGQVRISLIPTLVSLGVKAKLESDRFLLMIPRSSLCKRNLTLGNTVGVIDADYFGNKTNDGEIFAAVINFGDESVVLKAGERIVQGIISSYDKVDYDDTTEERAGGFGSTGN